jgi:hypothetical protein
MTIWKELYDIFDRERERWYKKSAGRRALDYEIRSNLAFLGAALKSRLSSAEIVAGLERAVFERSLAEGADFNALRKARVTDDFVDGFDEFKKYVGKDTEDLVTNAYARMNSLAKVVEGRPDEDHSLKIKSLFRFLVMLVMHLEGRKLRRRDA